MGKRTHATLDYYNTPPAMCLRCGHLCDAATLVGKGGSPCPGDVTVCIACAHVMAFDKRLRLRDLTAAEIKEVKQDDKVTAVRCGILLKIATDPHWGGEKKRGRAQ